MEETLGKRIAYNRKRMGLTQDQLAEQLGVTAQAVSKWENDQSCPDIGTLPKLAEIFGISNDALLGAAPSQEEKKTVKGEVCSEQDGDAVQINVVSGGKRMTLGLAVWLLLAGAVLLAAPILRKGQPETWTVLWSAGLLVFGIFGLYPKFSVFRLGCGLLGGFFLAAAVFSIDSSMLTGPGLILILGALLLIEALRSRKKPSISVPGGGRVNAQSSCQYEEDGFLCNASFGEKCYPIDLPRMTHGKVTQSFGELELDLTGVGEFADGCSLEVTGSFGELRILVPRSCRVQADVKTAFANQETKGQPDPKASDFLLITGAMSFGELTIRYI